jgi:DNA-directed RNA polymerase subunit F
MGVLLQFSQGKGAYCFAQIMPNSLIRVRFILNSERNTLDKIRDTLKIIAKAP